MKKIVALITLLAMSGLALAGGRSASMQVSFVIKEACAIQAKGQQATVTCNIDAPYKVQAPAQPEQPAAAYAVQADAGLTTIVF